MKVRRAVGDQDIRRQLEVHASLDVGLIQKVMRLIHHDPMGQADCSAGESASMGSSSWT